MIRKCINSMARSALPQLQMAVIFSTLAAFGSLFAQTNDAPPAGSYQWNVGRELATGVRFGKLEVAVPRKLAIHAVQVDSSTPGLRLHTTRRRDDWVDGKTETDRQTTRDFLRQSRAAGINMVLAVNADAFSPWPAPYNENTPSDLAGLAVADGVVVSTATGSPSLIRTTTGALRIAPTTNETDLSDVDFAVSGFAICLDNGQPVKSGKDLHPRTGLGVSEDGRYLIIVAIDGRQPASHGATTEELGDWLRHFGAHRGINMDGGGSTTLAWWDAASTDADPCKLLNRPVGNGIKAEQLPELLFIPTERANGNNFGVSLAP